MLFIFGTFSIITTLALASDVKESDLAGSWYPSSGTQLESQLKSYLDSASPEKINGRVIALIVPHAGYMYSGPVAAYGYKEISNRPIKTVILLGFSHRKYFDGVSVYAGKSWTTPLGEVGIDTQTAGKIISSNPRFRQMEELFSEENSVEMQIPFIQLCLKGARIVPVAFGSQNYSDAQALASVLSEIMKDRQDFIIIASTDLSHYYPYQKANSADRHTIDTLNRMSARDLYDEAKMETCELCGVLPVTTSLLVAKELGYNRIKELKYANSGDITGDKTRVVGYLSAVIYKDEIASVALRPRNDEVPMLNDVHRKRLLQIARESITGFVKDGKRKKFSEKDPVLNKTMGAFVTLHEGGELRGCIGNMVGSGPLYETVADMAIEAATADPRFSRLSAAEIDRVEIEISVLSPMKRVKAAEEIKIPGDGVIVRSGFNSGVYLPQVATETGWSKEEFLTSLCAHKAGLRPDAWKDPATELYTFTAEVFGEGGKANAK
jgi:AmmeMemoRadiSam system protein B/AmmeMemoRadiSam system protein A